MMRSNGPGFHQDIDQQRIKKFSHRSFGLVFMVVFALVGVWPVIFGGAVRYWSIGVAAAFMIAAFLRPAMLAPLNRVWTRLGLFLGRAVERMVIGLQFYSTVIFTWLLMRLVGKGRLRHGCEPEAASCGIDPSPAPGRRP